MRKQIRQIILINMSFPITNLLKLKFYPCIKTINTVKEILDSFVKIYSKKNQVYI